MNYSMTNCISGQDVLQDQNWGGGGANPEKNSKSKYYKYIT